MQQRISRQYSQRSIIVSKTNSQTASNSTTFHQIFLRRSKSKDINNVRSISKSKDRRIPDVLSTFFVKNLTGKDLSQSIVITDRGNISQLEKTTNSIKQNFHQNFNHQQLKKLESPTKKILRKRDTDCRKSTMEPLENIPNRKRQKILKNSQNIQKQNLNPDKIINSTKNIIDINYQQSNIKNNIDKLQYSINKNHTNIKYDYQNIYQQIQQLKKINQQLLKQNKQLKYQNQQYIKQLNQLKTKIDLQNICKVQSMRQKHLIKEVKRLQQLLLNYKNTHLQHIFQEELRKSRENLYLAYRQINSLWVRISIIQRKTIDKIKQLNTINQGKIKQWKIKYKKLMETHNTSDQQDENNSKNHKKSIPMKNNKKLIKNYQDLIELQLSPDKN